MGVTRRARRNALLEGRGRCYVVARAGSAGRGGHPFRWRWAASAWAKIRSTTSGAEWRIYRFER